MTPPLADPAVRRVAVVRLRVGLGDLLCSVPALRALRRARPDVHVCVVTWPEMRPVLRRMAGYVDALLPFPGYDGIPERQPDPHGWQGFVAEAQRRRFDLALQCYGDNAAANEVTAVLGAGLVGGFAPTGWEPAGDTAVHHLRYPSQVHEVWRHLRLVEQLGVPLPPHPAALEFPLTAGDEARHGALLAEHRLRPGRYAVLHPGASAETRRWPAQSYAAVGDALHADGLQVVLTGVASERPLGRAVATAMTRPAVDVTGATGLGGLAALLRDCAVLIGNDTGSAHLAAAVGAPSVTVFQPGDPRRWAYPQRRHVALLPGVDCAPCPHLTCPIDFRCSRATTPPMVLAAVRQAVAA